MLELQLPPLAALPSTAVVARASSAQLLAVSATAKAGAIPAMNRLRAPLPFVIARFPLGAECS